MSLHVSTLPLPPRRSLLARLGLAAALALPLAACGKGDLKKCEQMCTNYATISFREVEAGRLRPEEREKALADKLEKGTNFCVSKCQSANNDEQSDCMIAAKNMKELKACE
jgi:hypothetical protein